MFPDSSFFNDKGGLVHHELAVLEMPASILSPDVLPSGEMFLVMTIEAQCLEVTEVQRKLRVLGLVIIEPLLVMHDLCRLVDPFSQAPLAERMCLLIDLPLVSPLAAVIEALVCLSHVAPLESKRTG